MLAGLSNEFFAYGVALQLALQSVAAARGSTAQAHRRTMHCLHRTAQRAVHRHFVSSSRWAQMSSGVGGGVSSWRPWRRLLLRYMLQQLIWGGQPCQPPQLRGRRPRLQGAQVDQRLLQRRCARGCNMAVNACGMRRRGGRVWGMQHQLEWLASLGGPAWHALADARMRAFSSHHHF